MGFILYMFSKKKQKNKQSLWVIDIGLKKRIVFLFLWLKEFQNVNSKIALYLFGLPNTKLSYSYTVKFFSCSLADIFCVMCHWSFSSIIRYTLLCPRGGARPKVERENDDASAQRTHEQIILDFIQKS